MFRFFRFEDSEMTWDGELPNSIRRLAETAFEFIETEDPDIEGGARFLEAAIDRHLRLYWVLQYSPKDFIQGIVKFGAEGNPSGLPPDADYRPANLDDMDEAAMLYEISENALVRGDDPDPFIPALGPLPPVPNLEWGGLLSAYALWRLDQAISGHDPELLLAAVATAGRILSFAGLIVGAADAEQSYQPEMGRKGADLRWSALTELKREVRREWATGAETNKAKFIRRIKGSVLSDPRSAPYGLIESNIERTIRTWLSPRHFPKPYVPPTD